MPEQDDNSEILFRQKFDERYEKLLKAYYSCFRDSEAGQIVLKDLEDHFYKRTFLTYPIDPNDIVANEGARSVVIYIISKIEELEIKNGRQR